MNNEPVAWAMFKGNTFMDAIHPNEHTRFEGGYTIPLYTHPAKTLTDDEIIAIVNETLESWNTREAMLKFARSLLRKAQDGYQD